MATTDYATFNLLSPSDIGGQDPRIIIQQLSLNLQTQKRMLIEADAAYNGDVHQRQLSSGEFNRAFRHLNLFNANYLAMIVDAYVARLNVQGYNVGEGSDKEPNELAWDIWKANKLDKYAQLAHREAMKFGQVYTLVDPTTTVKGLPRVTVETPFQVVAWQDPSDRASNVAALKYWQAADGHIYANLFTTDAVLKFRSPQTYYQWDEAGLLSHLPVPQSIPWEQYAEYEHKLGKCPIFTIENKPTLTRGGVSELEALLPLQRAIDAILKNALIASDYSAFPQKWALNVEQPKDANGNPLTQEALEASLSRFWAFPPPGDKNTPPVSVGSFQATNMQNYTAVLDELVHEMSMISSLPGYRLIGKLANLSASAILAAEAGFIDATRVKQTDYSTGWESTMKLSCEVASKEPIDSIETIWKDPSAVSGPNLAASLVALQTIGVPQEILFRMTGASPVEVEEWMRINEESEEEKPDPDSPEVQQALDELTRSTAVNTNSNSNEQDEAQLPDSDEVRPVDPGDKTT